MELKYIEHLLCTNHHADHWNAYNTILWGGRNGSCQKYTFGSGNVGIFPRDELTPTLLSSCYIAAHSPVCPCWVHSLVGLYFNPYDPWNFTSDVPPWCRAHSTPQSGSKWHCEVPERFTTLISSEKSIIKLFLMQKEKKKKGSCFILESPNLCPIIHLGQGALPEPKTFHRLDQLPVKWPDTRTLPDRTAPCWVLSHVTNQSLVLAETLSRVKAESTGQRERDRTKAWMKEACWREACLWKSVTGAPGTDVGPLAICDRLAK